MRISPFVAAELVDGLLKRGFVEVKEKRILLKKDTRLMIQKKPELIATDDRPWRKIPEQFVQQKLEINQPYVPRIKEIKKLGGFANELD